MGCRVFKSKDYTITQRYNSNSHLGVDIIGSDGGTDMIVAHSDGVVDWCQTGIPNDTYSSGNRSYGNCVKIKHANGHYTLYAHLQNVYVHVGQEIFQGQNLGYMGNTGRSFGTHLHFEVRDTSNARIQPTQYLTASLPNMNTATDGVENTNNNSQVEDVKIMSESETAYNSNRGNSLFYTHTEYTDCEILIENGSYVYVPVVCGEIKLEISRHNMPSVLNFTCYIDYGLKCEMGNAVSFRFKGQGMFYGYVFSTAQTGKDTVSVKCYDALRYFHNKTSLVYRNKKYSDLLKQLCTEYGLRQGKIEDTSYVIEKRIEESSLFDILGNASDITYDKAKKLFVLYDDFGTLSLTDINNMVLPILIDESCINSFEYSVSIDTNVYTKVTIARNNTETGVKELYVAHNSVRQQKYGILEYYALYNELNVYELKAMAEGLIEKYKDENINILIKKCLGDYRVRGGSSLVIRLSFMGRSINQLMLVEKVTHYFSSGEHYMDLDINSFNL